MDIQILELIEGAKQSRGITVIIDVFRAFSLECYLFMQGAETIHPVGSLDEARGLKAAHPDWLLFGERKGRIQEGCDYGNSPSSIEGIDFSGKTILHSTSAGTQGIVNAVNADEVLVASLVNAKATADYIRSRDPETVSLVAMGNSGTRITEEDMLCADYLQALLEGEEGFPIRELADDLRYTEGAKFFDPARNDVFPQGDFALCVDADAYGCAIRIALDDDGLLVSTPLTP
ncbi:MAG: 2-phosphosulfolactate phosphatase [Atopobiaceae bacterium]|nr:2-phosphosulfolactate phosphatase [Atopobiaceae bacterium]